MINEVKIVDELLNGKRVNPYQLRYYCTLLVRHGISLGMSDKEIYKFVFDWANKNKYFLKLYLSVMVKECRNNHIELNNSPVYISNEELSYIKANIKRKISKKLALAIILYAKLTEQKDYVEIPVATLCDWIGYKYVNNVYNIYLKNLVDIGFISDCDIKNKWRGRVYIEDRCKKVRININMDFDTSDIEVIDNDICKLL